MVRLARGWAQATRKQLMFKLASLNLHQKAAVLGDQQLADRIGLQQSIRAFTYRFQGALDRVAFSFQRHGIFLEHGVGRGRPKGSESAARNAKPWLRPVLDPAVDGLSDLIADAYADITAGSLRFLIPGIIDTRIDGVKHITTEVQGRQVKVLIDPSFFNE